MSIPAPLRASATVALTTVVGVVLLGQALIYRTERMADGQPGLSVRDLQMHFTGGYDSLFEARVKNEMRQYFANGTELAVVAAWSKNGAHREEYERDVVGVLDDRCVRCHSPNGQASFRRLDSYEATLDAVQAPSAPGWSRQILIMKIHLAGIGLLVSLVSAICWAAGAPQHQIAWSTRMAFGGLFTDFGSWWLMRIDLVFAWGRVAGNILLLLSLAGLTVAALSAMYVPRSKGPVE